MPISPAGTPSRVQAPERTKRDILLPIACRFLPMDQWMTTYLRRCWGVNEAKIILLARCANPSEPFPPLFIEGLPTQDFRPPLEYSPELPAADIPLPTSDAEFQASSVPGPSSIRPGLSAEQPPVSLRSSGTPRYAEDAQNPGNTNLGVPGQEEESDLSYLRASPRTRSGTHNPNGPPHQSQSRSRRMGIVDERLLYSQSTSQAGSSLPSAGVGIQLAGLGLAGPVPRREKKAKADPIKQAAYIRYKALLERTGKALNADQYILWSYSTGQLIEPHLTLDSACIRPGEMIEIQRTSRHVTIPRSTYAQPYFETDATVYFAKEKDLDATPVPPSAATFSPIRSVPPPLPSVPSSPPPVPKPKPKLEPREPLKSRRAYILEIPDHPDEVGRRRSIHQAESLSSVRTPDSENTPRRKPRRSVSAHFTLGSSSGSNRAHDNNVEKERDRWNGKEKEKEKEASEKRVGESGLLPPSVSDALFGTTLSGIGMPSTPERETAKTKKAKKKAEKEAKATLEHLRNPNNWKGRVVMVKDGTLWVLKEEAGNSQSPLAYDLSDLLSVEEAGIPVGLNAAGHSGNVFPKSIRLRFRVDPSDVYGKAQTAGAEKVVVYVYIHITQALVHEHLLRVFFCFLKGKTAIPVTPSPIATSHSTAPVPISASKGISPTDQLAHSPASDNPFHRSSVSLSSSLSSSAHSLSSPADSDGVHPKKKSSLSRLRSKLSRKIIPGQKSAVTGSSKTPLQRAMTGSSDTLSSSLGSMAHSSLSPTSSPLHERRMSLRTAMRMGPVEKEERRIQPPFIMWRERLMKSCILAGKGETKLRRTKRGGKSVAHGPWQTDGTGHYYHSFYNSDAEDTDPEDFSPAPRSVWRPRKRYLDGIVVTGQVVAGGEPYSEFEWETWRTDFGFTSPRSHDINRFGVPQQTTWSPSTFGDSIDYSNRRGSVAAHESGSTIVSPKGKLVKPSPASLAGPMLSIAGSLIPGRTRSQSIQAMPLRSPAASPGPRPRGPMEPEVSLGSPLTPSSSSSFILPSPSAHFHRPKPVKSTSDFSVSRSRSTTISAATAQGGSLTPSTATHTPHYATPLLSTPIPRPHLQTTQLPITNRRADIHEEPESDDSGKSQVSLRSALSLPGQSTSAGLALVPPSPALTQASTSQVSSRWSQISEAHMVTAHRIDMGVVMGNTALASARAIATMSGMNPMSQGPLVGLGIGSSPGTSRDISRTSSPAASAAPSVASSPGPESKKKTSMASRLLARTSKKGGA